MTDPHPTDPPMHRPLARSRAPRRIARWAMAGIIAAPLLCLLLGLWLTATALRDTAGMRSATGTVASISQRRDADGTPLYRSNIRYHNAAGDELEGSIGDWAPFVTYDIGAEVPVLYSDDRPAELRLDIPVLRYGLGPYVTAFGAVLLAIVLWFRSEIARQPSEHWFGPPALPEGAAPAALPVSVRRDRPHGHWLGRRVSGWARSVLTGMAGAVVLLGLWAFAEAIHFRALAECAEGQVMAVVQTRDSAGGVTHLATIRYRDAANRVHWSQTPIWLGTRAVAAGQPVAIYYLPDRPERVRIADLVALWFPGVFFTLSGGLLMVLMARLRDLARRAAAAPDWERGALVQPQAGAAAPTAPRRPPAKLPSAPEPSSVVRR